ncbi:SdpI/YhfL family protein [Tissierella praeacuta]|uniref:SdpI family protein n=1 Tax=Tissierella praeacuta TaxID=43131 RepID=UPI0010534F84|nr:SdpI family protein [Tissierella praeacuta]TCU64850.1 SdpI/YhfL family protein [Tissierella praeacuta]
MGFWIFMFIVTLLIPAALLLTGYLCPKFKKINNACGYRTVRSMKNQDTWNFAQKYCSKISLQLFFPTIIVAVAIMPFIINKSTDMIGWVGLVITLFQMVIFVVVMVCTEKALKKNFDDNGDKYNKM